MAPARRGAGFPGRAHGRCWGRGCRGIRTSSLLPFCSNCRMGARTCSPRAGDRVPLTNKTPLAWNIRVRSGIVGAQGEHRPPDLAAAWNALAGPVSPTPWYAGRQPCPLVLVDIDLVAIEVSH